MSIGSERQEKIFDAWAKALANDVAGLTAEESLSYVRRSVTEAEKSTSLTLQEMDKRDLSDPSKARFVGTVVSILYREISSSFTVESAEAIRNILIEVYQKFPDHSE